MRKLTLSLLFLLATSSITACGDSLQLDTRYQQNSLDQVEEYASVGRVFVEGDDQGGVIIDSRLRKSWYGNVFQGSRRLDILPVE